MTRGEAEALVGFVRAAWDSYLDAHGEEAWQRFFTDLDADTATETFYKLRDTAHDRPTMYEFRQAYMATVRSQGEAARDPQPVREHTQQQTPTWVQALRIARADGDPRVISTQKPGYDALQEAHAAHRTYVWAGQDVMPPDVEAVYMARAETMTVREVNVYVRERAAATVAAGETPLPDIPGAASDPGDEHYPA